MYSAKCPKILKGKQAVMADKILKFAGSCLDKSVVSKPDHAAGRVRVLIKRS